MAAATLKLSEDYHDDMCVRLVGELRNDMASLASTVRWAAIVLMCGMAATIAAVLLR